MLICGCSALFAGLSWILYGMLFRLAPAQDFMVFYTAARDSIDGHIPVISDGTAFTAQLNERFGAWLAQPLDLHPWMYPPSFLLLLAPLGWLPFPLAYALFLMITFAALNCAMRCFLRRADQHWLFAVALLLSPATAFTVAVGQNGFMTAALLVGGVGWIGRAPLLAGILLGTLSCKPQLWLLVPVALVAAREWKVLASAIVTAGLLALAALVAFGSEPWLAWMTLMLRPSLLYQSWLEFGRLNGQSAYAVSVLLGASAAVASVLQMGVSLCCAVLVWWSVRVSTLARDLKLAVLLTATILAAPHVSNYDAVMVAVAVVLVLCRALEDGFRRGELFLMVAAGGIELLNPPRIIPFGVITPLVLCGLLAAIISRGTSRQLVYRRRPKASKA